MRQTFVFVPKPVRFPRSDGNGSFFCPSRIWRGSFLSKEKEQIINVTRKESEPP